MTHASTKKVVKGVWSIFQAILLSSFVDKYTNSVILEYSGGPGVEFECQEHRDHWMRPLTDLEYNQRHPNNQAIPSYLPWYHEQLCTKKWIGRITTLLSKSAINLTLENQTVDQTHFNHTSVTVLSV